MATTSQSRAHPLICCDWLGDEPTPNQGDSELQPRPPGTCRRHAEPLHEAWQPQLGSLRALGHQERQGSTLLERSHVVHSSWSSCWVCEGAYLRDTLHREAGEYHRSPHSMPCGSAGPSLALPKFLSKLHDYHHFQPPSVSVAGYAVICNQNHWDLNQQLKAACTEVGPFSRTNTCLFSTQKRQGKKLLLIKTGLRHNHPVHVGSLMEHEQATERDTRANWGMPSMH